jgi:hypothetical protein
MCNLFYSGAAVIAATCTYTAGHPPSEVKEAANRGGLTSVAVALERRAIGPCQNGAPSEGVYQGGGAKFCGAIRASLGGNLGASIIPATKNCK